MSVKRLVESNSLSSIPSKYVCPQCPEDSVCYKSDIVIPTIDFSKLTSRDPSERSAATQMLGDSCRDWGFFFVYLNTFFFLINHGVSEALIDEVVRGCESFFNLAEEEKKEFEGRSVLDPIRCGTSFNPGVEKSLFWRDYLKLLVHPRFHAPSKPPGLSEIIEEFCKNSRQVTEELLKGLSRSLGLEENYIYEKMNLRLGTQVFVMNYYPPCPSPELAQGLPEHTDHGLLTLLMQSGPDGLQVHHDGKWVPVCPPPNSFMINTGDHMEILTNGKYKSVLHRAMVNKEATRISVGAAHGPSLDTIVNPSSELITEARPPAYRGITYRDYLLLQQSNPLHAKSCLDRIRI